MSNMQTPCISICAIDPASGLCTGCRRTLKEIGGWSALSDEQRRELMDILPLRVIAPPISSGQSTERHA